jgi:hypothetical protein
VKASLFERRKVVRLFVLCLFVAAIAASMSYALRPSPSRSSEAAIGAAAIAGPESTLTSLTDTSTEQFEVR